MAKHQPTRRCIACRESRQKRDLVRIVRAPTGKIAIDPVGKASGRGAYLCATRRCWESALSRGILQHALKVPLDAETQETLQAYATALPRES